MEAHCPEAALNARISGQLGMAIAKQLVKRATDVEESMGSGPPAEALSQLAQQLQEDDASLRTTRSVLSELRKKLTARSSRQAMLALLSLQHIVHNSSLSTHAQLYEQRVLHAVARLCTASPGILNTRPPPDLVDKAKEVVAEWADTFPQPVFRRTRDSLARRGVRFPETASEPVANSADAQSSVLPEQELSEEDRNAIEQVLREDERMQRQEPQQMMAQQAQPAEPSSFMSPDRSSEQIQEDISIGIESVSLFFDQLREAYRTGCVDTETLEAVMKTVQRVQQRAAELAHSMTDEVLLSTLLDLNDSCAAALEAHSKWRSGQRVPELEDSDEHTQPSQQPASSPVNDMDLLLGSADGKTKQSVSSLPAPCTDKADRRPDNADNQTHTEPLYDLLSSEPPTEDKGKAQAAPIVHESSVSDPFDILSTTTLSTQPPCAQSTSQDISLSFPVHSSYSFNFHCSVTTCNDKWSEQ